MWRTRVCGCGGIVVRLWVLCFYYCYYHLLIYSLSLCLSLRNRWRQCERVITYFVVATSSNENRTEKWKERGENLWKCFVFIVLFLRCENISNFHFSPLFRLLTTQIVEVGTHSHWSYGGARERERETIPRFGKKQRKKLSQAVVTTTHFIQWMQLRIEIFSSSAVVVVICWCKLYVSVYVQIVAIVGIGVGTCPVCIPHFVLFCFVASYATVQILNASIEFVCTLDPPLPSISAAHFSLVNRFLLWFKFHLSPLRPFLDVNSKQKYKIVRVFDIFFLFFCKFFDRRFVLLFFFLYFSIH